MTRGQRMVGDVRSAVAFARVLAHIEEANHDVFYHLPYPNGGGVPRAYQSVLEQLGSRREGWDCVGAVMTILLCDRVQPPPWGQGSPRGGYQDPKLGYGYVNCDTMIEDADGARVLFAPAETNDDGSRREIAAGDIVVLPQTKRLWKLIHGHVGFLVGNKEVAHCSPGNVKRGAASDFAVTDARIFLARKDRRYLRYRHWAQE